MTASKEEFKILSILYGGVKIKGVNRLEKNPPTSRRSSFREGHPPRSKKQLHRKYTPNGTPHSIANETFSYRDWLGLSELQAALAREAIKRFQRKK